MNYIPLYRKYRPQTLEEIVGQEHIKKSLSNAISLDKISHAYLFTGPRGTGKTSTARIFAKSLNCKNGPTAEPCGTCDNCVAITNSTPLDVIEIDAASNRSVDDAQNILEKVMYAPLNSRFKIYIIDEVHMLTTHAFNALLKTLEEPPKNVIFILATTEVHKVLDTIKSRCQRYDFKRITTADICEHLKNIAQKEGINITDDAISTIAKNSAGGMRDSIAMLDQLAVLGAADAITVEDINNLLGRLSFDALSNLAGNIISSNMPQAIETLENIYNSGNEPVQILNNLTDYFKNLLIVKNCRDEVVSELTQGSPDQISTMKEQAGALDTHQIVFLIDKTAEYIKEVKTTNNPRLWLEVAIVDLANLADNTSLLELQNRVTALEGGKPASEPVRPTISAPVNRVTPPQNVEPTLQPQIQPSIEPQASVAPTPIATAKPVSEPEPTKVETDFQASQPIETHSTIQPFDHSTTIDLWPKLLDNIQSTPTRVLLKQWASPVQITPENTIIAMKNEMLLGQFTDGTKKQAVVDALDKLFGQQGSKVLVRLPQPDDAPAPVAATPTPAPQRVPQTPAPSAPAQAAAPASLQPQPTPSATAVLEDESSEESATSQPFNPSTVQPPRSDQANMVMDLFEGKIID